MGDESTPLRWPLKRLFHHPLVLAVLFAVLYGLLNLVSNRIYMPAAAFISPRPQAALPMFAGLAWGPGTGFAIGFFGNIIGDFLSGYGIATFWNWHVANGLLGLIPGLLRFFGIRRIAAIRDFTILELTIVLAGAIAVTAAVLADILWVGMLSFPEAWHVWILPFFITDAANGFLLVPALLLFSGRILLNVETRTVMTITFLLFFSVLTLAITLTWSVWDEMASRQALIKHFYLAGIACIAVILAGLAGSVFLARRITKPLSTLIRAAAAVEEGRYDTTGLTPLAGRPDEMGQLARVFEGMVREVSEREQRLRDKVQRLTIAIDRTRQNREVREITESQYFLHLKDKVRAYRKEKEIDA